MFATLPTPHFKSLTVAQPNEMQHSAWCVLLCAWWSTRYSCVGWLLSAETRQKQGGIDNSNLDYMVLLYAENNSCSCNGKKRDRGCINASHRAHARTGGGVEILAQTVFFSHQKQKENECGGRKSTTCRFSTLFADTIVSLDRHQQPRDCSLGGIAP